MRSARAVEAVWRGRGAGTVAARAALAPLEALYRAAGAGHRALYDVGILTTREPALPAVSVGNLTVGGTGKTPVAAWIARQLIERGARPAVVLRGYGGDEPLVHAVLNPGVPVVAGRDRVAGIRRARLQGADIAVLDDAFQHRRVHRVVDLVLVSADAWDGRTRLLPAGPWREPLGALRRATLVLVTRKAASEATAVTVLHAASQAARGVPGAVALVAPAALRRVAAGAPRGAAGTEPPSPDEGGECSLDVLRGARALAISAIGDPAAFRRQLEALGAHVDAAEYGDHHRFTDADARALASRAHRDELVVCTLKDAVKLGPLWPREAPPLWYVSQRVTVERGTEELDRALRTALAARRSLPTP